MAGAFELVLTCQGGGFLFQLGAGLGFLPDKRVDFSGQIRCGLHGVGHGLAGLLGALIRDGFLPCRNSGPGCGRIALAGLLREEIC